MAGRLHGLDQFAGGGSAGNQQPGLLELAAIGVVELIAVAMALGDRVPLVSLRHDGARCDLAGIRAQTHGAAFFGDALLACHRVNHRIGGFGVKLRGTCVLPAQHTARISHDCDLHAEANAEIGNAAHARIVCRADHAFHAARTKAPRQDDAVHAGEQLVRGRVADFLGIDPLDIHKAADFVAGVAQRLGNGQISVMQLDVFANKRDFDMPLARIDARQHVHPFRQVGLGRIHRQLAADDLGQMALLEHERRAI